MSTDRPVPPDMHAVEITEPGGPDVLVARRVPTPMPGPGEVLIRVAAAGVNRPDILQRTGGYPPPPGASPLPGLEVAGTVEALGPGVDGFAVDEPVCALLAGGGYAEFAAAPAQQVLPIPKGMSAVEAAGVPETFFTVWTNVFERGRLAPGETLLVHGGTSGIGTTAIQLAKAMGARVVATAGGEAKTRACRELGADLAIDYRTQDFVAAATEFTQGKGVDVILDMVGGDYVPRNLQALAIEGRHVSIAFLHGSKVTIDMARVMVRRQTLTGSTLRPRTPDQKGAIAAALKEKVWPLLEAGRVRPVIHATFPLAAAAEAHRLMESSAHIGKIILVMGS